MSNGTEIDLRQVLSDLVENVANLRVVTLIGDVKISGEIDNLTITPPTEPKAIVTTINLALCDVTTVVSQELLGESYKDLVTKHYATVGIAQDNVRGNIAALGNLLGSIRNTILPAPAARHSTD